MSHTATKLNRTIASSHGVLDSPPLPLLGRLGSKLWYLQAKRRGSGYFTATNSSVCR